MVYTERLQRFSSELQQISRTTNRIVWLRLITALGVLMALYGYARSGSFLMLALAGVGAAVFLVLVRRYQHWLFQSQLAEALVRVNEQETACLSGKEIPYEHGGELLPQGHAYAYDLDLLGKDSLFHHINRTATQPGKRHLANKMLTLLPPEQIQNHQDAIREITPSIEWRQKLQALGNIQKEHPGTVDALVRWTQLPSPPLPAWANIAAWILPTIFVALSAYAAISTDPIYFKAASAMFNINLLVLGVFFKRIQGEIADFDRVHTSLKHYGLLANHIIGQPFESTHLNAIKTPLEKDQAGTQIIRLSQLFSQLDSLANLLVVMLFDGIFLYHLHALRQLQAWKKQYATHVPQWLDAIGEMEALSSMANFAFNNPEFAYPELNDQYTIRFEQLGHPLIRQEKRVCNSVDFSQQQFIVLTGSNMSGKSTFLRSLGINMVLAGIGAPVCASRATVHPLPVWVSMRLSDSLSDSESFFFAEVKRLREITVFLSQQRAFILLDEILRGTNSDDKRMGTVGVLRKMVAHQAIGAIATHDIEVCNTTLDYPDQLVNKCFEVEMANNELRFDYTLREGICQNKSASFLMEKMGII